MGKREREGINYMNTKNLCGFAIIVAIALGSLPSARAQIQPTAGGASDTNGPTPAQRALALLKPDKLSATKEFSFKVESMVEVPAPPGQLIDYFFTSEVAVERPNKLAAKKRGDGPAFNLYYDGKQFTAVDEKLGLYAQMEAPPTIDELIPAIMERTGLYFPCADVLYSDINGTLTKDLTHAYWVDKSTVSDVVCDHLAFAGPGIEWQIWLGPEKDPLPRRLAVTYLSMARQPRFFLTFTDWNLNPALSEKQFVFNKPADAKEIQFRPLMSKNQ